MAGEAPIPLAFPPGIVTSESPLAAKGRSPQDATLEEMDALWDEAKIAGLSASR